ncbi:MAG: sulfatase-like hydrolase/transferase [Pseudohongiellaceae bacterium]
MRFLKLLLAAHLAAGLSFIVVFLHYFQYPATIAILHILLLFCGLALLLLPCLYLQSKGNGAAIHIYILLALPAFDFVLILIYSANIISNIIWGGNITLQLVMAYVADLGELRKTLPALNLYLIALPIIYLLLVAGYRYLFRRYYESGSDYRLPTIRIASYSTLALLASVVMLQINFDREDPGIWGGEPISNLFLDYIPMFEYDPTLPALQSAANPDQEGQQPRTARQNRNIIIIMVDALRADHLKAYGYSRDTSPFLSALHNEGRLISVDMVHSTCSESACGILSTLTGNEFEQIRSNTTHLGNILQANGYTSSFIVTGNHAWGGLRTMYDADYFSDGETRENYSVNDDAGIIDDLQMLDLATQQPNFLYFHLYSAHDLGLRHRQFNQFEPFKPSFNPLATLFGSETDRHQQELNNYDNGILQADFFIAQIFAQLEDKGILHNSIVYITSDHGQAFGEHGHRGHTRFLYEEHIRIPLFIYDAQIDRYQNTQYATHIDIVPTVLETLAIEPLDNLAGLSLLQPVIDNRITQHRSTILNGWKLSLVKRGNLIYKHLWEGAAYRERTAEMLFEITADPDESMNILETAEGREIVELTTGMSNR